MRRHVARILHGRFEVITEPDGEAALQRAVADPPDLVLSDVMMPRMDGFGLLAGLRAHERTRSIPVIMLSARAGEESAVEGLDAGADDYLIKPFSARELIARVSAALSLARLRQESAQRLEEINRELAAAAEAKTQFVAGISHEIRTPLNAIIGMTSLLLRSPLNETQTEFAQVLRSSGEHLLNLIGDVLDFSKIEAGAIQLERAPFDVRRCVQDALDIVAVDARAKQLPLSSHIGPDVPEWAIGDSGRLSQILINLLANAVKFTERGQVTLTLEAGAAGPYQCDLRFAISDTGIGISDADQSRLFEAFVQVADRGSHRREGTGLGLAISAQLAGLLGGAIGVQSRLGEGSTFTLTVPAGLVDPPAPAASRNVPDAVPAQDLRILVVDDNRANQRVTALLLGELGYAPDTVGNGIEAIEAIERQPYDLVFMDMQMPELSGLEATRIIRRRFGSDRGPLVVGLSGYASNDTRHECLAAGMNHYLVKPVTLDQFAATIAQLTAVTTRDGQ
jgi:signal transduction histidine kinase